MDTKNRDKEIRNRRFAREELGDLLRLFSSLGITVAAGIVGFFLLGLWVDRKLAGLGYETYGVPRVVAVLGGVALVVYWAYLRIARHLEKYDPKRDDAPESIDDDAHSDSH